MKSSNFKRLALDQLRGHWGSVIGAFIVPILAIIALELVAITPRTVLYIMETSGFSYHYSGYGMHLPYHWYLLTRFMSLLRIALGVGVFLACALFLYGVSRFLLDFIRTGRTEFGNIFAGFTSGGRTFGRSVLLELLISVFTFLWSMLLFIPGIVAEYRYAMAFYILADNGNMTAKEALDASKEMMVGHKWELFKLHLSFIGWAILSCLTCGIGFIFLIPYMRTAEGNFYEYLRGINSAKTHNEYEYTSEDQVYYM